MVFFALNSDCPVLWLACEQSDPDGIQLQLLADSDAVVQVIVHHDDVTYDVTRAIALIPRRLSIHTCENSVLMHVNNSLVHTGPWHAGQYKVKLHSLSAEHQVLVRFNSLGLFRSPPTVEENELA